MQKLLLYISFLLIWACTNKNVRDYVPKSVAIVDTSNSVISFSAQIKPILVDRCYKCHQGFTGKDWSIFAEFRERAITKFSDSDIDVKLLSKLKGTAGGDRMPLGGPYLSDDQIALIAKWVNQGAKEN